MDKRSYVFYKIPKKNGEFRIISEPRPKLKAQQKAILKWLMARKVWPSKYAHAFIKNRSIVTNARIHVGKKVVVKMDIKDFFGSINGGQICSALIDEGISRHDAAEITKTCILDGRLPQGAPTSPLLSNLVFKSLDYRLASLARRWSDGEYPTTYSRYADDLVFSSDNVNLNCIQPAVAGLLLSVGFKINIAKSKVLRNGSRQKVTGIVVNQTISTSRKERRRFRAELYNIKKALLEDKKVAFNFAKLQGKAAFLKGISVAGEKFVREVNEIKRLASFRQKALVQVI